MNNSMMELSSSQWSMDMGNNCLTMEIFIEDSIKWEDFMVKVNTYGKMVHLMMEHLYKVEDKAWEDGDQVRSSLIFILVNTKQTKNQEKDNIHGVMDVYTMGISLMT